MGEGQVLGIGADHFHAGIGINDHMGLVECTCIIIKAAGLDVAAAQEAMATRGAAAFQAINIKGNHFAIKGAENALQWAHPTQCARPPAHGFWPREIADHMGHNFGNHIGCGAARFFDHCDIGFALLVVLNGQLIKAQTCRFQKAINGWLRRINTGPLTFFARVGGFGVKAFDGKNQAAWRGVNLCTLIGEACINQRIGDHRLQIISGFGLHAGGNFF